MSAYILYHREDSIMSHPCIDRYIGEYGMLPIIIDPETAGQSKQVPIFASVEEAYTEYKHLKWVWLDANGGVTLDEFTHPEDNVVYAFGSDAKGFDGFTADGPRVVVRPFSEIYAGMCIPIVCHDRWSKLKQ